MAVGTLSMFVGALVPLALDGEAAAEHGSNGTTLAVLSAVSLVGGYLVLFLLWRYVFSAKARSKREKPPR